MAIEFGTMIRRLLTVSYRPEPTFRDFLSRGETQTGPVADVTVAVANAAESERIFGVPLARRGLQAVYLRICNHSHKHLRLHLVSIDPNYYTSLEAAALNHFSISRRLSGFRHRGVAGLLADPAARAAQGHHRLSREPADE